MTHAANLGGVALDIRLRPSELPFRECSVARSAVALPIVLPQEIGAELVEAGAADLAHHQIDLVDEDIDRFLDPGKPASRGAVEGRPAEETEISTEAQRDQD